MFFQRFKKKVNINYDPLSKRPSYLPISLEQRPRFIASKWGDALRAKCPKK